MKSKRRFLSLLVMTVMTAMLLSVPAFAKIKLDKKRIVMESDDNDVTLKLKGAKGKKVKWSTSNSDIVDIDVHKKTNSVELDAFDPGTATITAKVGNKAYKCKVTVKRATPLNPLESWITYDYLRFVKKNAYITTLMDENTVSAINGYGEKYINLDGDKCYFVYIIYLPNPNAEKAENAFIYHNFSKHVMTTDFKQYFNDWFKSTTDTAQKNHIKSLYQEANQKKGKLILDVMEQNVDAYVSGDLLNKYYIGSISDNYGNIMRRDICEDVTDVYLPDFLNKIPY